MSIISYRIECEIFIWLLWFASSTTKVETTTKATAAKVAASQDATREEDALTPA